MATTTMGVPNAFCPCEGGGRSATQQAATATRTHTSSDRVRQATIEIAGRRAHPTGSRDQPRRKPRKTVTVSDQTPRAMPAPDLRQIMPAKVQRTGSQPAETGSHSATQNDRAGRERYPHTMATPARDTTRAPGVPLAGDRGGQADERCTKWNSKQKFPKANCSGSGVICRAGRPDSGDR